MASSLIDRMSDTVSFTAKFPMLMKATSADDSPTQGIVYQEINDITYESVSSCTRLMDFLLERLKKNSPLVKYKVLKVLQYLVTNGHPEFRSALRHNAGLIRQTQSFRGTLDQLHGDSLNHRTRERASELIEMLFDVDADKPRSTVMTGPSKKMEGFGNTPFQPMKNESWRDTVKTLTGQYVADFSNLMKPKEAHEKRLVDHFHSECGGHVNLTDEEERISGIPFTRSVDNRSSTDEQMPRWKSGGYNRCTTNELDVGDTYGSLTPEIQLVNEITAEGGIRSVPSREMLTRFSTRCANLNVDKALELLNQKLEEPVTDVQLKSLCVIDHLLKCDLPNIAFKASRCCPNLEALSSSGQEPGSVKAKASKILTIIKVQTQAKEKDTDLLRIQQEQTTGHPRHPDVHGLDSLALVENSVMFNGMDVHSTASVSTSACPLFAMETTKEMNTSDEVSRMFEGFDISSSSHVIEAHEGFDDQNQHLFGEERALQTKETAKKDNLADIFDPLCQKPSSCCDITGKPSDNRLENLLDLSSSSCNTSQVETSPRKDHRNGDLLVSVSSAQARQSFLHQSASYSGFTSYSANNSIDHVPVHPSPSSLSGLTGFTSSAGVQASVSSTMQGPGPTNMAAVRCRAPYVGFQSPALSSTSTIPLRLPKPSAQKSDFGFVGKTSNADAFGFVQDEMRARKK